MGENQNSLDHPIGEHNLQFKNIFERLERVEKHVDKIRMEGSERLLKTEASILDFEKRIDKEEKQTEAMLEIATSVKLMSVTLQNVVSTQENHGRLLEEMSRKDGKLAIKGWVFVGAIVGTSTVTWIISLVAQALK